MGAGAQALAHLVRIPQAFFLDEARNRVAADSEAGAHEGTGIVGSPQRLMVRNLSLGVSGSHTGKEESGGGEE